YADWHHKNKHEKLLAELNTHQAVDLAQTGLSDDFKRIQFMLNAQKKSLQDTLSVQYQHLIQLEHANYARLAQELTDKINQYNKLIYHYHLLVTSGTASAVTLDLLYKILAFGIMPLASALFFGFSMLNQIKSWSEDINAYISALQQYEQKINYLMHFDLNEKNLHIINKNLIQVGLAPLMSGQDKMKYLFQEMLGIEKVKKVATDKIIAHSYWYSFMLTGMTCLFFCANPAIGLGIFGTGIITYGLLKSIRPYASLTKTPMICAFKAQAASSSSPFVKIIQRAREFCEIPTQSPGMALAF
ncbi:MAG: hypothetical protein ABSF18_05190, partial [Gammaproteobacteria bacterium]